MANPPELFIQLRGLAKKAIAVLSDSIAGATHRFEFLCSICPVVAEYSVLPIGRFEQLLHFIQFLAQAFILLAKMRCVNSILQVPHTLLQHCLCSYLNHLSGLAHLESPLFIHSIAPSHEV